MSDFDSAMADLSGMTLVHNDPAWSAEELRAACDKNMACIRAYGRAQRALLQDIQAAFPDRSVDGIWNRSYRRSISEGRAPKSRRWKAKAIGLNPDPLHNAIALSGMTPIQIEDRWHVAVAIPQPAPTSDGTDHIQDVVLIDPVSNTAQIMFDRDASHIAPPAGMVDRLLVLTDPKEWARHIALERLEWWNLRRHRQQMIKAAPIWNGWPTAALLMVPAKKMRWRELDASVIQVPAEMRETVRRAVLAEARLPKIEGRA